eukprot:scaffold219897_cov27-Tisochrysis_lutea.AAC.2
MPIAKDTLVKKRYRGPGRDRLLLETNCVQEPAHTCTSSLFSTIGMLARSMVAGSTEPEVKDERLDMLRDAGGGGTCSLASTSLPVTALMIAASPLSSA